MKYVDFSSLVQLGVGLHLGTALLQSYADIAQAPFIRTVARIRSLTTPEDNPSESLKSDLETLESDYEVFKIRLFKENKNYFLANGIVAMILTGFLVLISFKGEDDLPILVSFIFAFSSIAPAGITLLALWVDAERAMKPLRERASTLEARALRKFE